MTLEWHILGVDEEVIYSVEFVMGPYQCINNSRFVRLRVLRKTWSLKSTENVASGRKLLGSPVIYKNDFFG